MSSTPEIADLVNIVVSNIEDKYCVFGTLIGLKNCSLRAIERERPYCKERFIEVLHKWKEQDPESFTWGTVIKVLQSDALKATKAADVVIDHLCR